MRNRLNNRSARERLFELISLAWEAVIPSEAEYFVTVVMRARWWAIRLSRNV